MTQIAFNPVEATPPFSSTFILDGKPYSAVGTWNIYAQRWYLTLTSNDGYVVWAGPIIGSPAGYDIELAPGIFQTSKIIYRAGSELFEITP